jgi:hypothetical protein
VLDSATADRTEYSIGGRLDTHELSNNISPLLVRGVVNNIDVFHNDICSASSYKGTIYLRDLEGYVALRLDLLIEILLVFRLARCYRESVFDEELPVFREVRELPDFVAVFGAGCDNIILAGKIGGIAVDEFVHGRAQEWMTRGSDRGSVKVIEYEDEEKIGKEKRSG